MWSLMAMRTSSLNVQTSRADTPAPPLMFPEEAGLGLTSSSSTSSSLLSVRLGGSSFSCFGVSLSSGSSSVLPLSFECFAVSVETPPSLLDSRIDVLLLLVREGFLDLVDFFLFGNFVREGFSSSSLLSVSCGSTVSFLHDIFCELSKLFLGLPSFFEFLGASVDTTGPPSILDSEFDSRELSGAGCFDRGLRGPHIISADTGQ